MFKNRNKKSYLLCGALEDTEQFMAEASFYSQKKSAQDIK